MYDWRIVIEARPQSGPLAKAWPRVREFLVKADDFEAASQAAEHIRMGVHSHNGVAAAHVWCVARCPTPAASME